MQDFLREFLKKFLKQYLVKMMKLLQEALDKFQKKNLEILKGIMKFWFSEGIHASFFEIIPGGIPEEMHGVDETVSKTKILEKSIGGIFRLFLKKCFENIPKKCLQYILKQHFKKEFLKKLREKFLKKSLEIFRMNLRKDLFFQTPVEKRSETIPGRLSDRNPKGKSY